MKILSRPRLDATPGQKEGLHARATDETQRNPPADLKLKESETAEERAARGGGGGDEATEGEGGATAQESAAGRRVVAKFGDGEWYDGTVTEEYEVGCAV
eukprot:2917708-Rhodomonas_salina.1